MPSPEASAKEARGAPLLELRDITKDYPGVTALANIFLKIGRGEMLAIAGANGAGKSTLVRLVAGVEPPDQGMILLEGEPLRLGSPRDAIDLGIHTIHQELHLAPHLSVAENIFLGRIPKTGIGLVDWPRLHQQAEALLEQLGVSIDIRQPVSSLTVAKRQIVEIAKSLGQECRVLILDEPSAVLGRHDLRALFKIIASLKASGTTILYISHRLEEVFEISDRVAVLRDGRKVRSCPTSQISMDELIEAMTGRTLTEMWPHRLHQPGKVALELRNLGRSGYFEAVSFRVRRGEIVGLAGKVGSGRSDVARVIFGAERPDTGQVLFFGKPGNISSPRSAIRQGVGLVPEDRKHQGLLLQRSILENVTLSNLAPFVRWGLLKLRSEFRRVRELCESLLVKTPALFQVVKFLSGGNQQKVVLARWLNSDSDILILDEPTRGVDVAAKVEIYKLVEDLARRGKAILMISSEEAELLQMADRIVVMREGCVTGTLERNEIGADWARVEKFME